MRACMRVAGLERARDCGRGRDPLTLLRALAWPGMRGVQAPQQFQLALHLAPSMLHALRTRDQVSPSHSFTATATQPCLLEAYIICTALHACVRGAKLVCQRHGDNNTARLVMRPCSQPSQHTATTLRICSGTLEPA